MEVMSARLKQGFGQDMMRKSPMCVGKWEENEVSFLNIIRVTVAGMQNCQVCGMCINL